MPKHHVASFLNKLCHYATEAGEACGPTGAEKLPRKVQEVDAESWNYFYIFDMCHSKNQSLISDSNIPPLEKLGPARQQCLFYLRRPSANFAAGSLSNIDNRNLSLPASSLACHFQWALPSVCSKSQKRCCIDGIAVCTAIWRCSTNARAAEARLH